MWTALRGYPFEAAVDGPELKSVACSKAELAELFWYRCRSQAFSETLLGHDNVVTVGVLFIHGSTKLTT